MGIFDAVASAATESALDEARARLSTLLADRAAGKPVRREDIEAYTRSVAYHERSLASQREDRLRREREDERRRQRGAEQLKEVERLRREAALAELVRRTADRGREGRAGVEPAGERPTGSPGGAAHGDYVEFEAPWSPDAAPAGPRSLASDTPDHARALRLWRYVIAFVTFGLVAVATSPGFGAFMGVVAYAVLAFFMRKGR